MLLFLAFVFYFVISPASGHKKAEAEHKVFIQKITETFSGSKCTSGISQSAGAGMWFEQSQNMSCSIPAKYGQCQQVKEAARALFESMGFSVQTANANLYYIRTKTSVGSIADLECQNWERPEPRAQIGFVQISFEEKD